METEMVTTFKYFPRVPLKVRARIWEMAFDSRVLGPGLLRYKLAPAKLASKESWAESLRQPSMSIRGKTVHFNPETDTLIFSCTTEYMPPADDPRLEHHYFHNYRLYVTRTNALGPNAVLKRPLLPHPIVPHPKIRTAMILTGLDGTHNRLDWNGIDKWQHQATSPSHLVEMEGRYPITELPGTLFTNFPALETLWRAGSFPWGFFMMDSRTTYGVLRPMCVEFRYFVQSKQVMIREMTKSDKRDFWSIQMSSVRGGIHQPHTFRMITCIRIVRGRAMTPADTRDGWRAVLTAEEEDNRQWRNRFQSPEPQPPQRLTAAFPDRILWRLFGGEVARYVL
ncbi:hypothetical protein CSHISOI_07243 [Colletotrichum shisoi]|uniref:2EXR domain-containing protein n=1 Tax=Colletotrichum shisoi TaxID=2078593 RepID=A0A5Q4BMK1_9PEZI|nr:hypothetical protein CSHISOI_07243 [Colletotrichum shisoi]